MGVLNRGILGGFRGSVGPVTGTSWKGIDVMKSKPLSVANPRTPAQTAQRGKFAGAVSFAKRLLATVVKPLWDRFAQKESGYNAFIQANIGIFNENGNPSPADALVISQGNWDNVSGLNSVNLDTSGQLFFNANTDGGLPTDEIYVAVYDSDDNKVVGALCPTDRSEGDHTIELGMSFQQGNTFNLYIATRRADGTAVSNTIWTQENVSA